ncbi:HAD family hydrolase [Caulobacter mirabilis]|uniref:HAD family hydrolase n=1 Tax=Caulobacter mirabilis TaxID=69666 RepID=A0A2D2ATM4_9CAUL|nr:HAD family phosphatase [Caulobacter mirabilis]ATQ41346.1 HAD family hydrolase [Caulobacter mirabilis]
MRAPRAVLWDVGNVIVDWSPRRLFTKIFQEPAACDRFLSSVCTMDWHAETDRGVSPEENTVRLAAQHPEFEAEIRAWWDRWDEMFDGAIPETEAVMEALAERGVPQFALTNMSHRAWPGVRAMSPVFRHLRDSIVSAEEGLIKPDPAIYEVVLRRAGLESQDFLFIDDSAPNIEAARAMGFHVHRFEEPARLWPALTAFGLLAA